MPPSKLTPEVTKRAVEAIKLGSSYKDAAAWAGISQDTFTRWMQNEADFADAIKNAEGAGRVGLLAKIEKAINDGAWQAAAWKLERRDPEHYGRKERVELTGKDGGAVQVEHKRDLSKLSDTDLDLLTALLAKADGEQH